MEFIFNFLKLIQERKLVPSSVNYCIPLKQIVLDATVGGRNPAPVDMVNIPLFTRFYTSHVVVWDFFHQHPPSNMIDLKLTGCFLTCNAKSVVPI